MYRVEWWVWEATAGWGEDRVALGVALRIDASFWLMRIFEKAYYGQRFGV